MGKVLSPLGSLLEELREERRLTRRADQPAPRPPAGPVPAPDLKLTVSEPRPLVGLVLLPASTLLHVGLALSVVAMPILMAEGLPTPASGTRVFFAEPALIAPPPPPPAPAAPVPRVRKEPPPAHPTSFTAPLESPEEVVPEETAALGVPGGEPGGVEGGAPGGVVGGIVGGLPEVVAPPAPVHVGGGVREPTKVRHVDPVYPEIAVRANVQGIVVVECLVSPQGRVTDVRILRGIPLLNAAALEAVRQWAYTPTLVDGVPVPLIMTVTVRFSLK